jgi:hypothetical protein
MQYDNVSSWYNNEKSFEKIAKSHEEIIQRCEKIVLHRKKNISRHKKIAPYYEEITMHCKKIIPHREKITLHRGKITLRHEKITLHRRKIILHREKIAPHREKITLYREKITLRHEKIAPYRRKIILHHRKSISNSNIHSKKSKKMNGKIIATKLHKIENGILGAQNNSEIRSRMSVYGYTPERISEGRRLLDEVTGLMSAQVEEYGEQYVATDDLGKRWKSTYANYMITVKVVRVAFNGQPELLQGFNATGKRNRSLSGWLRDARILYINLLNSPEAITVMGNFGYSREKLNAELEDVNEVENLHSRQLSEKSSAQQATLDRDTAFDTLYKWYGDFRAIAKVAMFDKPQLLEALGIIIK